jgi:hypothetical protein
MKVKIVPREDNLLRTGSILYVFLKKLNFNTGTTDFILKHFMFCGRNLG